jgi:autotransporter-associated beta strand protein
VNGPPARSPIRPRPNDHRDEAYTIRTLRPVRRRIGPGGTQALSGTNGYSGVTTINGGTIIVGHSSALGTRMLKMAAGTTLSFVNGAAPPRESALASREAGFDIARNWSVSFKFDGGFANASQTYAGTGTLRHTW